MISEKYRVEIEERGSNFDCATDQLKTLKEGLPFITLTSPATPTKGILSLSEEQHNIAIDRYAKKVATGEVVVKFVPASGAASRMFQNLFQFLEQNPTDAEAAKAVASGDNAYISTFFNSLEKFAFFADLKRTLGDNLMLNGDYNHRGVIEALLTDKGLSYGSLPKGLLKFHSYSSGAKTPMAEHIQEAIEYAESGDNKCRLHFTVSPEHVDLFKEEADRVIASLPDSNISFNIEFSTQKPSTDTIASTPEGEPFIDSDGKILFRPGGHGALIENLNEIDADIIFIKNIDNVVPETLSSTTTEYKRLIGGLLVDIRDRVFHYLDKLDGEISSISDNKIKEIVEYVQDIFSYTPAEDLYYMEKDQIISLLKTILNRPIRVCGVVKNLGEPGGGPFICRGSSGELSPQIVEGSQIDMGNPDQKSMAESATHFNPVDIVCSTKNYKGEQFNLSEYIDKEAAFISAKSKSGKSLKALELPGLWNGAMAYWNTIFVEVPVATFNPVKSVNDLLREEHQNS